MPPASCLSQESKRKTGFLALCLEEQMAEFKFPAGDEADSADGGGRVEPDILFPFFCRGG